MNTCLLCDKKANSREHYIPDWLSKACEAQSIVVMRGYATDKSVTEAQPIGPFREAKSWILCKDCNKELGRKIESPVGKMISQYISPNCSIGTLQIEPDALVKWMVLRALEASVILKRPLLRLGIGHELVDICKSARDGTKQTIWPWFTPSLEAVLVQEQTLGCTLSESFYSSERGAVRSAGSGFWFFLQMNRLGLLLIHAPSAQRNNTKGYGLKLFPPGARTVDTNGIATNEIPTYDSIGVIHARLTHLNTETGA
jgi:hypothetical protein